jgi:hypothetical protein
MYIYPQKASAQLLNSHIVRVGEAAGTQTKNYCVTGILQGKYLVVCNGASGYDQSKEAPGTAGKKSSSVGYSLYLKV